MEMMQGHLLPERMPTMHQSQAAWMEAPNVKGWAAFKVTRFATGFHGYGMGSYSFFNQGVDIFAATRLRFLPRQPSQSADDLPLHRRCWWHPECGQRYRWFSTIANPDVPVTVVDLPITA